MKALLIALGVTLASPALAQQGPIQQTMGIVCYPSAPLESYMIEQGFTSRLIGAFDDGDLLTLYMDGKGNFHAGFALPQHGYTCMLGPGSGLERVEAAPNERGS